MGDVGVFFFFFIKNLGVYGDGGLIIINDLAIVDLVCCLRVYGFK